MHIFGHHQGYIVNPLYFTVLPPLPCRGLKERNKNISLYLLGWEFSDTVMVRLFPTFVYHETPGSEQYLVCYYYTCAYHWLTMDG